MIEFDKFSLMTFKYTLRLLTPCSLAAFSCLFAAGCDQKSNKPVGQGGSAGGAVVSVEAVIIQSQPIQNKIYATGTFLANEEVELRSEISGRITKVLFEEGRRVNKGELMLKINDRELTAQLKRKTLEEKLASDEESRKRNLFEIHAISQEEYDKALSALRMIQAEKEVIESQLAKTEITAPFDGVVGLRYVSEGGYVTPNMLAATMQDIDPMKVEFSVPEKYARLVKNGLAVVVRIGESEDEYRGAVYAIESKIDPGTRTIKARAQIPNSNGLLIPGSFARVEITLQDLPNAIVIPAEAIIPEMTGNKVFVCRNGKAASVPVEIGIRTERNVQITEGLVPNDTLILTGLLQLTEGKAVRFKEPADQ
ncbi:MAG TPA: efflux RND transporter periplasmic adaptor subunit [Candidatus Deferrimicrobium sp.]|nr:efflux RND transporter periplasmic adaptor subunit [Candidatus Deferrimicrobium sp.]